MFPMIGRPFGPGGYEGFLENFLEKMMKRRRGKNMKRREVGKERRGCSGKAMAGTQRFVRLCESMSCDDGFLIVVRIRIIPYVRMVIVRYAEIFLDFLLVFFLKNN